ncbi:MAG: hypothetical protein ABEJ80_00990 [Halarchaeum sp.]
MAFDARYFGYLGVLLLALVGLLLAVFGPAAADGANAAQLALLAAAGLCAVAGGFPNPLRERVGAAPLVGLADVSLGASLAVSALTVTDVLVLRALFVLGGLFIALLGANYLLRGRLFEMELPA